MGKKPVLVIMAAGMGSRYGGLKQMDPVGGSGELIIDFSLYDAWRAGYSAGLVMACHDRDLIGLPGIRRLKLRDGHLEIR